MKIDPVLKPAQVAHHAELLKDVEATEATLQTEVADLAAQRAQLAEQQAATSLEAAQLAAQKDELAAERTSLEARSRAVANAEAQAQVCQPLSPAVFIRFCMPEHVSALRSIVCQAGAMAEPTYSNQKMQKCCMHVHSGARLKPWPAHHSCSEAGLLAVRCREDAAWRRPTARAVAKHTGTTPAVSHHSTLLHAGLPWGQLERSDIACAGFLLTNTCDTARCRRPAGRRRRWQSSRRS